MKTTIKVKTQEFKDALEKAYLLCRKSSSPIVEDVAITLDSNTLVLSSTNLNDYVEANVEFYSEEKVKTKFLLKETSNFKKAFKFFKGHETQIEISDNVVKFTCDGKAITQHINLDPDLFENSLSFDFDVLQKIETARAPFFENVAGVIYATKTKSTHAMYAAVHFNGKDAVACDGFRLAVKQNSFDVKVPINADGESLKNASKILSDAKLKIEIGKNHLRLTSGVFAYTSVLIEGEFLDYKKVVPNVGENVAIKPTEIIESLKYLKNFVVKKTPIVWENNTLKLTTPNGKYSSELGEDYKIDAKGYNAKYLLDGLTQFKESDKVFMRVTNALSPTLFYNENFTDTCLVLPVRL